MLQRKWERLQSTTERTLALIEGGRIPQRFIGDHETQLSSTVLYLHGI